MRRGKLRALAKFPNLGIHRDCSRAAIGNQAVWTEVRESGTSCAAQVSPYQIDSAAWESAFADVPPDPA